MNMPIGEPSLALPGVQFHDLSSDDFHRTSPLRSKRNSLGALHNRQHENQFGYGQFVIETSGFDLSDQALTTEQPSFISTSSEVGELPPLCPEYSPVSPISPFAASEHSTPIHPSFLDDANDGTNLLGGRTVNQQEIDTRFCPPSKLLSSSILLSRTSPQPHRPQAQLQQSRLISPALSASSSAMFSSRSQILSDEEVLQSHFAQGMPTAAAAPPCFPTASSPSAVSCGGKRNTARKERARVQGAKSVSPFSLDDKESGTPVCRYYLIGHCFRGEHCKFRHEKPPSEKKKLQPSRVIENTFDEYPTAELLRGKVLSMCQTQKGCRILQQLIDERDATFHTIIFDEMLPRIQQVMIDQFGNYLCQKLIDHSSTAQHVTLINTISKDIFQLSVNNFGTRVVQKLIDSTSSEEEIEVLCNLLYGHISELMNDYNGNHVVQRMLLRFPPKYTQFVFDIISQSENIISVATHKRGCCVLQRCIEYASDEQKVQLVGEIVNNALALIADSFGNYVIQYVIELPVEGVMEQTINVLLGHTVELAMQKYSSNVLEKIIKKRTPSGRSVGTRLIDDIIANGDIPLLSKDHHATYVIQACIESQRQIRELNESLLKEKRKNDVIIIKRTQK